MEPFKQLCLLLLTAALASTLMAQVPTGTISGSVQDESGALQTFKITPDTVAEADLGVIDGAKFQTQSGTKVRIVSSVVDGAPAALFVRTM